MKDIEQQLRENLTRVEPPEDFAARVLSCIPSRTRVSPVKRWMGVAAALLAGIIGLEAYQQHRSRERLEGEQARAQLIQALRVTSQALQATQHKLSKRFGGRG